ncbi:MAG: trans-sulfuration enzyme family protein [Nitrososphaerales archaeon]
MADASIYTLAVHAGERATKTTPLTGPDAGRSYEPVVTPVHHSVGYTYADTEDLDAVFAGTSDNPVYTRYGNPTVAAFETAVAALEGGEAALAYGSGMAAIHAALLAAGARAGTAVVAARDVYGATYALLNRLLATQGVAVRFVDVADLGAVAAALEEFRPVALLAETVSNPLLKVADLRALARLSHTVGAKFIVDNTFATPVLCRPLALDADFVVHSATKYLGGHGDVLGGVVVVPSRQDRQMLNELNKLLGANLAPQEAWLVHRGLKTLPLRMERQCRNAARVAAWLEGHVRVARVNYPGLRSHPQYGLAEALFGGELFGGMISFDLTGAGRAEVFRFLEALRLVQPATTLGDVYTLTLYPAMSSHRALDSETRARIGIGEGLVRLSVGIEDPGDIISDLEQALAAM